jgi:hypothetical protein
MRKGKDPDPDPDPYLWLMNPDPDLGGQKNMQIRLRIRIPNIAWNSKPAEHSRMPSLWNVAVLESELESSSICTCKGKYNLF